jgi:hypothetical protein
VTHLSGQDVDDCLRALIAELSLNPTSSIDYFLLQVRDLVGDLGRRFTILTDALDESRDPFTIAGGILRRLAVIPGVRVLVGTRRSLGEDPDRPQSTARNLIVALNPSSDNVITLEPDPDAVTLYVRDRLDAAFPGQAKFDAIRAVANTIGRSGHPFLFARLAVHEVVRNPELLDPTGKAIAELLEAGHSGAFAAAIEWYRSREPAVEALLHALAYARGNGFPRSDGLWAQAGSALAGTELLDSDIQRALQLAASYIMQGIEHGQTVYRLAHRTFAEYYQRLDDAS